MRIQYDEVTDKVLMSKNGAAYVDTTTYGTHHQKTETTVELSNTSETPVEYLSMTTPIVPAGDYRIDWFVVGRNSNAGGKWRLGVQVDDTTDLIDPAGDGRMEERGIAADASQRLTREGSRTVTLTNAAHTIDIDLSQSGPGTATVYQGGLVIRRVN
jgi:hypothetical protein